MIKHALYSGKSFSGQPFIHLVEPGSTYGMSKTAGLDKTSSHEHLPEVLELIESISPQPGRLYLVNSALGAGEYVGFNMRGDWFTEAGLTRTPPGWHDIPVWDIDAKRKAANCTEDLGKWGQLTWGYPTFYNAHRFRHHINKDPNKAYGFILGAFWDPRMKRVILVSELIEDNCRNLGAMDIYTRIQNGEFPDSSMGSKVPYDRCSICGNIAKNPMQYCKHVSKTATPPYGLGNLLPDGRRCGVYNDYPRFFDDSFVFVGAERSAKVMTDVTPNISGTRVYSQTIYPFKPSPILKMASAEEGPKHEEALPDYTLPEKLDAAARHIPISNPRERKVLLYFLTKKLKEEDVKKGILSPSELAYWSTLTQTEMQRDGFDLSTYQYLEDQLISSVESMYGTKLASLGKVGEILKEIPASSHLMSVVETHQRGMKPMTAEMLDNLSEDPFYGVRAAAKLGIILKPHEFQHVMLNKINPELAQIAQRDNLIFKPQDISNIQSMPDFNTNVPILPKILSMLSPMLENRSFAPKAIKIRIIKKSLNPIEKIAYTEIDNNIFNEIGRLYDTYRLGLLKEGHLRWNHYPYIKQNSFLDLEENLKVAEDTTKISSILMHYAYWPSIKNVLNF